MRAPALLSCIACLLIAVPLPAVIIDQIAIAVGDHAITSTQITEEIKLAALQNGTAPDFGEASRHAAADRLIEQALIRREMEFGSYPSAPAEQIDSALANTRQAHGGEAKLARDLERYGLTERQLHDYLAWQINLLRFIDLRFRPAVQISRSDVLKYYNENYQARAGSKAPALSQLRAQIEAKLVGDRVDKQVDQWLEEQRKTTTIRFLDSSLGKTTVPAPGNRADYSVH